MTNMPNFKKEFEKAKHFYFKIWRGNEKPCPAFNGEVVKVTRAGWNHIRYLPERNFKEILERLLILPVAKSIIENRTKFKEYRKVENTEYWSLEQLVNGKRIRVIVRSVDKMGKHFFSVFIVRKIHQKKPLSRLAPR